MIKNYRKLILAILLLGLFLPVLDAQAWNPFGLKEFAIGAVTDLLSGTLFWIFSILGKFLAVMVSMLDWVVRIRIYTDLPIIQSGWKIMRDFANMLFIIALIVMAYGTIFNIKGYDFRSLIPRFIIIAVLINFSLVLSGLIIDATQVLNNTFLNAMGDISGRLGQGLRPADLLPASAKIGGLGTVVDVGGATIITLVFGIWFLFAFIVSVGVPLAVAVVRIPVLWALLIVSPMAWLLSILPATRGAYQSWWKQFLAWNLFLPYYLFFLYFALFFLSQQSVVLEGMLRGPTGQAVINQKFDQFGIQNSVTFGLLFFYILVAIFLIGGTKVAMSAGRFSGTGVVNVAKWGRGVAMRRFGVTAWQEAAKAKRTQIEKEGVRIGGVPVYTGREGLERKIARRKEFLGIPGERAETYLGQAGERVSRLEKMPLEQARVQAETWVRRGSEVERIAARKWQAKKGHLNAEQIAQTIQDFGGENSRIAVDFAKDAKTAIDKWSYEQKTQALQNELVQSLPELQKTLIMSLANSRQLRDPEQFREYLTRFENDPEGLNALLEAIDKAGINILYERNDMLREMAAGVGQGELTGGLDPTTGQKLREMMATKLKDMKAYGTDTDPIAAYNQLENAIQAVGENTGNARDILSEVRKFNRALWQQYTENRGGGTPAEINDRIVQELTRYFNTTGPTQIRENNSEFWNNTFALNALGAVESDTLRQIGEGASGIARQRINDTLRTRNEAPLGTIPGQGGGAGGQPPPQQPPQGPPPPPAPPRRPAGFMRPGETAQQGNVVDLRNRQNQP